MLRIRTPVLCPCSFTALTCGIICVATPYTAAQPFPAWPQTGDTATGSNGTVVTFTRLDEPTSYAFPVTCNGVEIGTVDVMYGLMARTSNNITSRGAYIRFGFNRNDNDCCPEPQYEDPTATYRWMQVVVTNDPIGAGQTPWVPFLDHGPNQTNPWYSNTDQGRWGYDTAADDLPTRLTPPFPEVIVWEASTTLVCEGMSGIHTLFSFHWGFMLEAGPTISRMSPTAISPPIDTLINAMEQDPAAAGYSLPDEGCCCVPTPGIGALWLGASTLLLRRHRAA